VVPRFRQVVGHISPIAWAMDGYSALIFHAGGLGQILVPIGVLVGLALVSFGFATRSFR
jgi:ABC-2 type transport system permease protein